MKELLKFKSWFVDKFCPKDKAGEGEREERKVFGKSVVWPDTDASPRKREKRL